MDEFTDEKLRELKGEPPQAIEKSPSEKYPFYSEYFDNLKTGTIIALENLDPAKIKWSTTSNFKKNALQEIATTFYKKLGKLV